MYPVFQPPVHIGTCSNASQVNKQSVSEMLKNCFVYMVSQERERGKERRPA